MSRVTITTQAELTAALKQNPDAELDITGEAKLSISVTGTASPLFVVSEKVGLFVVAWGSSQPRVVAWESTQPRVVARESSQPRVVAWESSQPRVVARESSQP